MPDGAVTGCDQYSTVQCSTVQYTGGDQVLLCSGCGPGRHLRQEAGAGAEREERGAQLHLPEHQGAIQ